MEPIVGERVIVLVDMDCFYVQVEQRLCPEYNNTPCIVTQYNSFNGGGIIAVNYEARACGVKRGMRGDDALKICPNLHNFKVPESREKANLTRYREAGAEVIDVLSEFCDCVERASVDEAFLDMTKVVDEKMRDYKSIVLPEKLQNTFVVGWDKETKDDDLCGWLNSFSEEDHIYKNDQKLALAAVIVEEMRAAVYEQTKFRCSAGIAHNKILAKLTCGLHKPNKQTVLSHSAVPILYRTLSLKKVRGLGGKFGDQVKERLGIEMMGELAQFSESQLITHFGVKSGSWLHNIANGVEYEAVTARQLAKSIGCGKNFPGKQALDTRKKVLHWLEQLSAELTERLVRDQLDNKRVAKSLTISIKCKGDQQTIAASKSCAIHVYEAQRIANDSLQALQKLNNAPVSSLLWQPAITGLQIVATKFEDSVNLSIHNIQSYFSSAKFSRTNETNHSIPDREKSLEETTTSSSKLTTSSYCASAKLSSETHETVASSPILKKPPEKTTTPSSSKSIKKYFTDKKDSAKCIGISNNSELLKIQTATEDELCSDMPSNILLSKSICDKSTNEEPALLTCSPKGFFAKKRKEKETALVSSDNSNISSSSSNEMTINQRTSFKEISSNQDQNLETVSATTSNQNSEITRTFFQPKTAKMNREKEPVREECDLSPEISFLCCKCNKRIPCWEEQEHSDFHFALEVEKNVGTEKNSKFCAGDLKNGNLKTKVGIKRGAKSRTTAQKKIKRVNTLDSFFK